MDPKAKRLLAVRAIVARQITASLNQIVALDAQIDALPLDDSDAETVAQMKATQDEAALESLGCCTETLVAG